MKHFLSSTRLPFSILVALHIVVMLAGLFAPYDPATQDRKSALAAPMTMHLFDSQGGMHRPFVIHDGRSYPIRAFVRDESGLHLFGVDQPARIHLLGTDEFGRDQFSRLLWGGRISLATGWLAAILALSIGLAFGSVAGFFGGWCDALVMRGTELFLALPWLYLLLAVRAFLPLSLRPEMAALLVVAVIGAVGWARPARLFRGIILSAKERDYVYAARGFGASNWHILTRHCLPETYGVLATQAALLVPQYVLAEVVLSFVGLGVGEPAPSWGNLLTPLRQISIASAWWMALPVIAISLTFWCFLKLEDVFVANSR